MSSLWPHCPKVDWESRLIPWILVPVLFCWYHLFPLHLILSSFILPTLFICLPLFHSLYHDLSQTLSCMIEILQNWADSLPFKTSKGGDQNQERSRMFIPGKVTRYMLGSILKLGEYLPFQKGFDKLFSQPVQLCQKQDTWWKSVALWGACSGKNASVWKFLLKEDTWLQFTCQGSFKSTYAKPRLLTACKHRAYQEHSQSAIFPRLLHLIWESKNASNSPKTPYPSRPVANICNWQILK